MSLESHGLLWHLLEKGNPSCRTLTTWLFKSNHSTSTLPTSDLDHFMRRKHFTNKKNTGFLHSRTAPQGAWFRSFSRMHMSSKFLMEYSMVPEAQIAVQLVERPVLFLGTGSKTPRTIYKLLVHVGGFHNSGEFLKMASKK